MGAVFIVLVLHLRFKNLTFYINMLLYKPCSFHIYHSSKFAIEIFVILELW